MSFTVVFTHLPSAIFLALLPAPSSLFITVALLVARSALASMDQAPRSAFLSAVVLPEERTAVMGIVNTVKTLSQSSGPLITGVLAADGRFWIAFVVAGSLKASYDVAMLSMFASTPLAGEQRAAGRENGPRAQSDNDDDRSPEARITRA
jgi:sugar phosphate permease